MRKIAALLLLIATTASAQTRLDLGGTGANLSASPAGVLVKETATSTRLTTSTSAFDPTWLNFVSLANCTFVAVNASGNLTCGTYVTSSMIQDATIVTGDIATGGVTSTNILDATIASGDISTGGVTSTNILDATIASGDIATGGVTSTNILDATIASGDISTGGVTSTNILDATIASGDIATGGVTSTNVLDATLLPVDAYMSYTLSSNTGLSANQVWFASNGVIFEGATANTFEGLLTLADPTADITWTLPNVSGSIVTTGDSGSVTSAMISDSTITGTDVANSTITYGKIQNISSDSRIIGRGSSAGAGSPEELSAGTGISISGTSISTVPDSRFEWVPADKFAGIANNSTQTIGTTNIKVNAIQFNNTTTSEYVYVSSPGSIWDASSIDVQPFWTANITTGGLTKTVVFTFNCLCIDSGEAIDNATWGSSQTMTQDYSGASTAYLLTKGSSVNITCGNSCTTGDAVAIRVRRIVTGADDLGTNAFIIGMKVTY